MLAMAQTGLLYFCTYFQQPFYTQQLKGIKIPWAHKVIP